ncbi:MAG: hypothetical protein UY85_C0009G0010 [Candidatus Peribacteria bacterium GW2011_GWB1_54_5]|nr:MAG: hypothetical protein UY85_C0009G0010 [Candidatus Peribacteria bacterium GW2011_GWB1_54_5]
MLQIVSINNNRLSIHQSYALILVMPLSSFSSLPLGSAATAYGEFRLFSSLRSCFCSYTAYCVLPLLFSRRFLGVGRFVIVWGNPTENPYPGQRKAALLASVAGERNHEPEDVEEEVEDIEIETECKHHRMRAHLPKMFNALQVIRHEESKNHHTNT